MAKDAINSFCASGVVLSGRKSVSPFPSDSEVSFVGLVFLVVWNCVDQEKVGDMLVSREKCVEQLVAGLDSCGKGMPTYGFVAALYGSLSSFDVLAAAD